MKKFLFIIMMVFVISVATTTVSEIQGGNGNVVFANDYTLGNQAEKLVVSGIIKPIAGIAEIPLSMADGITKRDSLRGKLWGMTVALPFNAANGVLRTLSGGLAGAGNLLTGLFTPEHIEIDLSDVPRSIL